METIKGIEIEKLIEFAVAVGWERKEAEDHIGFFENMAEQYRKVEEIMKGGGGLDGRMD